MNRVANSVYELIYARIRSIQDPPAIDLFFQLLKILIEDLNLGPENPKMSLTVPRSQNRFVVNLNARYAITLEHSGSIGLLIETSDFQRAQKVLRATSLFRFSKAKKPDDYFLKYPAHQLTIPVLNAIVPMWLKACRNLEPKMSRSPYRKFHSHELYELMLDDARRMNWARRG